MNRIRWFIVASFSFTGLVLLGAPTPGSADLNSPGTWTQAQSAYGDSSYDSTDLGLPLVGDGTNLRLVDPVEPTTTQRFYRVLAFP
jgi:hypothetical protein